MSFFAIIIRNQAGDESLWTIFGQHEVDAIERFADEMPEIEVSSYDVRELPQEAAAEFGRFEPDMRIVHHSGTWTDQFSGDPVAGHPVHRQTIETIH